VYARLTSSNRTVGTPAARSASTSATAASSSALTGSSSTGGSDALPRLVIFDAFGDDAFSESVSERDRGVDDGRVGGVRRHPGDEGFVDLDLVDWEGLEVGEGREPGSEVVE